MNKTVRDDILNVLKEAIRLLGEGSIDASEIKEISNHTIHNASIFQDEDSIAIAILVFVLSKVAEKGKTDMDYEGVVSVLENAEYSLENDDIEDYRKEIKRLFRELSKLDNKLKIHIQDVIDRAQIKKGERIYAQGISLERTAELLGLNIWELSGYIGKKGTYQAINECINVRKRVSYARGLFR